MKPDIKISNCPVCGAKRSIRLNDNQLEMRRKAARSLASHLAFTFQISPQKELVLILGNGNERNNHEAISNWVMDRISHIRQWPLPSGEVNELIAELEHDLERVLSDLKHGSHYVQ